MPDVLSFTKGLPMRYIPISCYKKAHERLMMHSDKCRMVVAVTSSSYLCITSFGLEHHKKLTKALVSTYRARIRFEPNISACIPVYRSTHHLHTTMQPDRTHAYHKRIGRVTYVSGSNSAVRASDQRPRSTTMSKLQMFARVWSYVRWLLYQARAFHARPTQ